MISVTHLRAGTVFEDNGEPYVVVKYEHVKMGRGTANIKIKAKHLKTGSVIEKSYISGARVQELQTTKRKLQYLYRDTDNFYFMNPKTFEQVSLSEKAVDDQAKFLVEGITVDTFFLEDTPLSVELPSKMDFKITETEPGVKGDSATNIYKSATLENGLQIKVPLFINSGERVWIDTRTGEYIERVK